MKRDFKEFSQNLEKERDAGVGVIDLIAGNENTNDDLIDLLRKKHNLKPIKLEEVNSVIAKNILIDLFSRDLTYGVAIMTPEKAEQYVKEFFGFFSKNVKFYTAYWFKKNIDYEKEKNFFNVNCASFGGLMGDSYEITLDCGILVVGESKVGIIWFGDFD